MNICEIFSVFRDLPVVVCWTFSAFVIGFNLFKHKDNVEIVRCNTSFTKLPQLHKFSFIYCIFLRAVCY